MVHNLFKKFGEISVLKGVSFEVQDGEFVGLVGPNGAGKTTLIECICGITKIDSGEIKYGTVSLSSNSRLIKKRIGACFQEDNFDRFFNIFQVIKFNAQYHGFSASEAFDETVKILSRLKLTEHQHKYGYQLSGGLKRRVQLAQAVIHDPDLLILDETTAGVDLELKDDIYKYLRHFHERMGKIILLTSHYIEELSSLCQRVIFLKEGRIVRDIKKTELNFSNSEVLKQIYRNVYYHNLNDDKLRQDEFDLA